MTESPPLIVAGDDLTAADVYGIWKIRDVVFAVEQRCDEPDVDDLDLLAGTLHLWFADAGGPTSYLRLLTDADADGARRVGRVCTRVEHRGRGLSGRLVTEVNERFGDGPLRLNAQAHLEGWYGRYGYVRAGENHVEAGIDHVPMARPATSPGRPPS